MGYIVTTIDALRPGKQLFSHVETTSVLLGLKQPKQRIKSLPSCLHCHCAVVLEQDTVILA